ncbi:MAG: site-specific DNA-methyltransferase [bacterium]|nr:site-specific DNA-methyltransferase [bacterium]
MNYGDRLLDAIGIKRSDKSSLKKVCDLLKIKSKDLLYYNDNNILPDKSILDLLNENYHISETELKLAMGLLDLELIERIAEKSKAISELISEPKSSSQIDKPKMKFETSLGQLYQGDCIELMKSLDDNSVDMVFADPPFNLNKDYPSGMNDNIKEIEYLKWSEKWLLESCRILKDGGSLLIWNLPKWNIQYAKFLTNYLNFRHWIAVDIKYSLPISGRLYPSHYSLLYFTKGNKKHTFHPDRLPMEVCNKCYNELKDYGGYKSKMNPNGINQSDVWYDIPPVRHNKFKARKEANELSIKLLDRIIEMSTNPGDLIFDPFGGAGTTYITSELKDRRWIGIELGTVQPIIDRFNRIDDERDLMERYRSSYNQLFPQKIKVNRKKRGIWTDDTFLEKDLDNQTLF